MHLFTSIYLHVYGALYQVELDEALSHAKFLIPKFSKDESVDEEDTVELLLRCTTEKNAYILKMKTLFKLVASVPPERYTFVRMVTTITTRTLNFM